MVQLDIFHNEQSRQHTAQVFIQARPECFRPEFSGWLKSNWTLYQAFEREAIRTFDSGRTHYGANTIIEYLRHHTLVQDADAEFKVNDRFTSSMVRLFAMMNPRCADMFEIRERKDGVVKGLVPA